MQSSERFAFFAMLPLFVLYLHHRHGFSEPTALLFGVFYGCRTSAGCPLALLTDRKLGRWSRWPDYCALLTLGGALAPMPSAAVLACARSDGHRPQLSNRSMARCSARCSNLLDIRRERGFLQHLAVNIAAMSVPLCGEWSRAGLIAGTGCSSGLRWRRVGTATLTVGALDCCRPVAAAR